MHPVCKQYIFIKDTHPELKSAPCTVQYYITMQMHPVHPPPLDDQQDMSKALQHGPQTP